MCVLEFSCHFLSIFISGPHPGRLDVCQSDVRRSAEYNKSIIASIIVQTQTKEDYLKGSFMVAQPIILQNFIRGCIIQRNSVRRYFYQLLTKDLRLTMQPLWHPFLAGTGTQPQAHSFLLCIYVFIIYNKKKHKCIAWYLIAGTGALGLNCTFVRHYCQLWIWCALVSKYLLHCMWEWLAINYNVNDCNGGACHLVQVCRSLMDFW